MAIDGVTGIQLKINRAIEHRDDLNVLMKAFLDSKPYLIEGEHHPDTGALDLFVMKVTPTPPEIVLVAGDVIQNLRASLDHLAAQLVWANGGTVTRQTSFPIFDSAAKYATNKTAKIQGIHPDAIKIIDDIEPYQGGKGHLLWVLHELNNTDKHRLLMTAAAYFRHVDVSAFHIPAIRDFFKRADPNFKETDLPEFSIKLKPADAIFPLKEGERFSCNVPSREIAEKLKFAYSVSFQEPQTMDPEPIMETLDRFGQAVGGVVDKLAR